jgi:hypothetical protein
MRFIILFLLFCSTAYADISLVNTTDKLQAVLGSAVTTNEVQCTATWVDITTTASTPGRSVMLTTGATSIDLVVAPDASTQRLVKNIECVNKDTELATITFKYNANATTYTLWSARLLPSNRVTYSAGDGWKVFMASGQERTDDNGWMANYTIGQLNAVRLRDAFTSYEAVQGLTFMPAPELKIWLNAGETYWYMATTGITLSATADGSSFSMTGAPITFFVQAISTANAATTVVEQNNGTKGTGPNAATSPAAGVTTMTNEGFITPYRSGWFFFIVGNDAIGNVTTFNNIEIQYMRVL